MQRTEFRGQSREFRVHIEGLEEPFGGAGVAGDAVEGGDEESGGDGFGGFLVVGAELGAGAGEGFIVPGAEGDEDFAGGDADVEGGAEVVAEGAAEAGEEEAGGVVAVGFGEGEHEAILAAGDGHADFDGAGHEVLEGLLVEVVQVDAPGVGLVGGDGAAGAAVGEGVVEDVDDVEVVDPFLVEAVEAEAGEFVVLGEEGEDLAADLVPEGGRAAAVVEALDFAEEVADLSGEVFGGGEVAAVEADEVDPAGAEAEVDVVDHGDGGSGENSRERCRRRLR